jgi:hypothetical protein
MPDPHVISMLVVLLAHLPLGLQGPSDRCWCPQAVACDGWCRKCGAGYFSGVRIESRALYDALDAHGHEVFADRTKCDVCRGLIRTGGFCEACQMGFIHGVGYFGRLGYHTAAGQRVDPALLSQLLRWGGSPLSPDGWCPARAVGLVGTRVFVDWAHFHRARQYLAILRSATIRANRCEDCAMAMVADARCPFCAIEYSEGHPTKGK